MRTRHLVGGLAVILAIAVAVPALGVDAVPSASVKKLSKKLRGLTARVTALEETDLVPGPQGPEGPEGPPGPPGSIAPGSVGTDELAVVPGVKVNGSASVTVPDFTLTQLPLNSAEEFDTAAMHDSGAPSDCTMTPSNCTLTIPERGVYLVTAIVRWTDDDGADPGYRSVQIRRDGGTIVSDRDVAVPAIPGDANNQITDQQLASFESLDAGQVLTLHASQESENAGSLPAVGVEFAAVWVAPLP
jgi:hypothetical protein